MAVSEHYARNGKVGIHYYDSRDDADERLVPIVVCPGLSETAEEYLDFMEAAAPRRCILLSFRGRGKSDTPEGGYNLQDHLSDLEAVAGDAGVESFHLFAYSRGVSYALQYAHSYPGKVCSITVGDYPPEHRAMPDGWAEDYIHHYLIPYNRTSNIRTTAVWGIQRESVQLRLDQSLKAPIMVARGLLEGSLIAEEDLARYQRMSNAVRIKEYARSGHALKGEDKAQFYADIIRFVNEQDGGTE
ncbi:alpha/beta hydrolase [Paenibacillus sp. BK720]|uniref:alpha/beta fold hydrolase n=1 Tax=Paenibacillus sp. BK720 TaxID=2587092 RepID=UPI00141DE7DF|nr:alpha/beta hydrolase [Paenibacillus sp. BK720]NIK67484.1 pimeloyl-ACP methyl ester carboxylesterase [Paenibacillus sp. BK720]